jgi:aryl sulfotransferase
MVAMLRAPTREFLTSTMDSHRWDKFVPRTDDIVVATYPKCGTTWTQRIVDLLIFQDPTPRPVVLNAPWLDATIFTTNEADLETLAAQKNRRFLKSHMPFDSIPIFEGVKYIHTARDGRDSAMSMHNHLFHARPEMQARWDDTAHDPRIKVRQAKPPADPREYFLQWIAEAEADDQDYGADLPFFEFENTYWRERGRENLLFVHYNDLKADLAGEMRRIADFLSIPVSERVMRELVEAATFEQMKKDGASIVPMAQMAWDNGSDRFIFKGTNGRWKDVLTADDLARYDAQVAKKWSKATANWMANGRLVAGDPRTSPD